MITINLKADVNKSWMANQIGIVSTLLSSSGRNWLLQCLCRLCYHVNVMVLHGFGIFPFLFKGAGLGAHLWVTYRVFERLQMYSAYSTHGSVLDPTSHIITVQINIKVISQLYSKTKQDHNTTGNPSVKTTIKRFQVHHLSITLWEKTDLITALTNYGK